MVVWLCGWLRNVLSSSLPFSYAADIYRTMERMARDMAKPSGPTTTTEPESPGKRFRVAYSFTGERRGFVKQVADILADRFGEAMILYDKYHEAEFARRDLGIELPSLYREHSDLIVAVLCPGYEKKSWTGLEWIEIHALHADREDGRVMLCRF